MDYAALRRAILEGPKAAACAQYVRTYEDETDVVDNPVQTITLPDGSSYTGPVLEAADRDGRPIIVPAAARRTVLKPGVEKIPGKQVAELDASIAQILNSRDGDEADGAIPLVDYMRLLMRDGGLTQIIAAAAGGNQVAAVAVASVEKAGNLGVAAMDFSIAAVREQHEALVATGAMTQQMYDTLRHAAKRRTSEAERALGRPVSAGEVSIALRYGAAFPAPEGV